MNDATKFQKKQKFLLGTFALGHMANDWVGGTIWLIAPALAANMGLGPAEIGLLLAVNGIGAGITYVPAGIAADRFPRQGILLWITFWWVSIGYFSASLVSGFWPITLLLAFGIMGDAFWHPVATGVLVKRMPTRRAQVLGIHAMGGSIGAEVLGPLTAGLLLIYFDWRTSLQILVLPTVIMGVVFFPVVKRIGVTSQQKISKLDLKNLMKCWATSTGCGLIVFMLLYNMSLFAIFSMTPLFLQKVHGLDSFLSGVIFASMLLLGTLCQPFMGTLSDKIGRKKVILTIMFAATVFACFTAIASELILFIGMLIMTTTLLAAVRPVVLATAVDFSGKSEATTLGFVFAILDGVAATGALLAGYVGEIDLSYVYLLAAGLAFLAAIMTTQLTFKALIPDPQMPAFTEHPL